jgi:hypothetical protein
MRFRVLKSVRLTRDLIGMKGNLVELHPLVARRWVACGYLKPEAETTSLVVSDLEACGPVRDTTLETAQDAELVGVSDVMLRPTSPTIRPQRRRRSGWKDRI